MTNDDEAATVPIRCPECDTTTRVEMSTAADAIERHNEQLHDGDDVAGIDPDVADEFANLIAEDLGLLDEGA